MLDADDEVQPGIPAHPAPEPLPAPPWLVAWLPALVAVLTGLPTLLYPFGRDQGNYAYAGWVMLEGGAPYSDVFIFKPPATALVHSVALGLFGVNMTAIRILDLGWTALTAATVALLAHRLLGKRDVALFAGVMVPLLYWQVDYWNIAQTDGWLNLPCALAILAVLVGGDVLPRSRLGALGLWTLAGVLAGVAVTFKYTAAALGLPLLFAIGHVALHRGSRAWLAFPLLVLGGVIPLLSTWGWLVAVGGWDAFVDVQTELVPEYVRRTAKARTAWQAIERLFSFNQHKIDVGILWYAGVAAWIPALAQGVLRGRRGLLAVGVVGSWWAVGVTSVLTQGKYYDYHYLPLLAPTALLLGMALPLVVGWVGGFMPRVVRWGVAGLALVGIIAVTPLGARFAEAAQVVSGARTWNAYLAGEGRYNYRDYDLDEQRQLVDWLRAETAPDDHVFIWAFDPAIHIWAQRRGTTRFLYNYPFRVAWGNPTYEAELMDGLRADPPEYVIIARGDHTYGVTGNKKDSETLFRQLRPFHDFVTSGYERATVQGRYTVWRRKPGTD